MEIKKFLEEIKKINSGLDFNLIKKAAYFAQEHYKGLVRSSGQTYFDHCLEVALSLAKMKLDSATIAAAILHEILERSQVKKSVLQSNFGEEITFLVEGVTNVGKIEHQRIERNIGNLRKLFLAMAKDIRVVLIKLVNRLHGLSTLYVFPEEKQKRFSQPSRKKIRTT